jgi:hypothetical protein
MMRARIRLLLWFASNVLVLVALPPLFARWVWHEVQEEYRLGLRTSTGGDSIGIPIAGFTALLVGIVIAANVVLSLYWLLRRRRAEKTS